MPYGHKIKQILSWLAPTGAEVFIYLFIAVASLVLSNADFFKELLLVPRDFSPLESGGNWLNTLVENWLGERAAGVSTAIFWGVIGAVVYLLFWLATNFKTELGNDLAITHWAHPANTDAKSPLKIFIETMVVRLLAVYLLLIYISYLLNRAWPSWAENYSAAWDNWPQWKYIWSAILTVVAQMVVLHGFVVLSRLIFLKKRLFFSKYYQDV